MLTVEGLSGGYHRKKSIVQNISFEMKEGDILCVLGPNGCGKTTLFKLLLGFLPKQQGEILIEKEEISHFTGKERARKIAYIPQAHTPAFHYSVFDMVLLGRVGHLPALAFPGKLDYQIANEALKMLGIEYLAQKQYTKISGGERQLVLIARGICQQAKFLIMDEPSSNLDYANQRMVMETVQNLSNLGYGVLLSTHSPDHPFRFADKALLLKNGEMVAFGKTEDVLTESRLREVYGIPIEVVKVEDKSKKTHTFCLST